MKVLNKFFKPVLEELYQQFPFCVKAREVKDNVMKKLDSGNTEAVLLYLKDKGLVMEGPAEDTWRITAKGIDFLEGRDLLEPEPGESSFFPVNTRAKS